MCCKYAVFTASTTCGGRQPTAQQTHRSTREANALRPPQAPSCGVRTACAPSKHPSGAPGTLHAPARSPQQEATLTRRTHPTSQPKAPPAARLPHPPHPAYDKSTQAHSRRARGLSSPSTSRHPPIFGLCCVALRQSVYWSVALLRCVRCGPVRCRPSMRKHKP